MLISRAAGSWLSGEPEWLVFGQPLEEPSTLASAWEGLQHRYSLRVFFELTFALCVESVLWCRVWDAVAHISFHNLLQDLPLKAVKMMQCGAFWSFCSCATLRGICSLSKWSWGILYGILGERTAFQLSDTSLALLQHFCLWWSVYSRSKTERTGMRPRVL